MLSRRFHISLFFALAFIVMLVTHLLYSGTAHGLTHISNPITVTSRTYTEHFPDSIDLQANVQDTAGTINQAYIVLTFNPDGETETHTASINHQGNTFVVSWQEDTNHD
ncbi:MAG TPA: hypothetical protein VEI53_06190, partial [Ktedonobacteraceae bacterium]|nr:hypothetical protein [Ktedonobacteraceae bacterium]